MDDERPPIERVLDLALYAPVGAAITLREQLPKQIRQGRQAMENRVQLARFIGQMAVQMGQRELAKRIEEQRAAKTDQMAESEQAPADTPAGAVGHDLVAAEPAVERVEPVEPVAPVEPVEPVAPPAADMLPISDYESLAAIHVVERLRSMSSDEIELIRRFEVAHRSRRTILAKIDQLQGR
jgi:uncharacterized protein YdbL (DUF1318 family)